MSETRVGTGLGKDLKPSMGQAGRPQTTVAVGVIKTACELWDHQHILSCYITYYYYAKYYTITDIFLYKYVPGNQHMFHLPVYRFHAVRDLPSQPAMTKSEAI